MDLNLVALITLAAAFVAAALLLRRYLPRAPAAPGPVCLRCGTPAAALTSFTCPGCGADVRDAGLGRRKGASPLRPFWTVVAYTCLFVFLSVPLAGVFQVTLPNVHTAALYSSMTVSSPQVQGVELYLKGRGPDQHSLRYTLTGDLYATGGVVTLEAALPAGDWRLVDLSGRQLDAGKRLDGQMVYRWLERAGVDITEPVARSDAGHIAGAIGSLTRTRLEMPPVHAGALSLTYSSSAGGFSGVRPNDHALPVLVIALSAAWLAGLWLVLAGATATRKRATAGAPAGEPSPSIPSAPVQPTVPAGAEAAKP